MKTVFYAVELIEALRYLKKENNNPQDELPTTKDLLNLTVEMKKADITASAKKQQIDI